MATEEREQVAAQAVAVVARMERADRLKRRGLAALGVPAWVLVTAGVIFLQWRIDLWLTDTGPTWRTVALPFLIGLYLILIGAPAMAGWFVFQEFDEDDRTGPRAVLIVVLASVLTVAIVVGGGWGLGELAPSGLTGVLVFALVSWAVGGVFGVAAQTVEGLVTGGRIRLGLDPRDRLYADLLGLLAVADDLLSPEDARGHAADQPTRARTLVSEQAFGWRSSRKARRVYGDMFERTARTVENSFHSIVPLRQAAVRRELRLTGQRIAATLRAHAARLMVDRSSFEADISDKLAAGLVAALRDDWRLLAVTEPPNVSTRLLRKYGLRWAIAALLVAAGIVVPELAGNDVLPGFRALAVSAGILLAIDSPSGTVRWFADVVKAR
ncbi:hypothetical protein [Kribbella sindirgiensis]|uniref:Uncharacterized protein n=1 Tax=Kribbella sindirgiensis TaxID=1124744 RepID=A0A4R0IW68_9ACTN|nr:hypothetical protein [Kribbella sindirgiensis]TCC37110.1 hypothetical protein E0H50_10585 [Kribbella sindirgiensis]